MYFKYDDHPVGHTGEKDSLYISSTSTDFKTDNSNTPIPEYLQKTYWWAYLHPKAVKFFERQWLVNLILFGNYRRLQKTVLEEIDSKTQGDILQVACVYGDFSKQITGRLCKDSQLHIIDVAPIQLSNTARKLANHPDMVLHQQDSSALDFDDENFATVIVFFLLHEQPSAVREKTIREAIRVTENGGKTIFIDYHRPKWYSPFRWLIDPVLRTLEPYAHDLWRKEIHSYIPVTAQPLTQSKTTFFMEQYQKVVITKPVKA